MKKLLLLIVAMLLSTLAFPQSKPSYKEARAIYDELGKPVSATGVWHTKPISERIAAINEADVLIAKVENVFGDSAIGAGAECRAAAISRKFYILNMNDLVLITEGRRKITNPADLIAPMRNSVEFGEHKARCYDYIELMDTKK